MVLSFQLISMILLLVAVGVVVESRYLQVSGGNAGLVPQKRPFCNAFTGCGMKRSLDFPLAIQTETMLDRLSRKVLAEARLWEMLQQRMVDNIGLYNDAEP
ncbi:cardioactive peptide-like [Limulus polyphemus]|uniref:Cardioactive peptide-like n=1 Tax=Limulus polyphemus TaxID=6850 RepID=A0ABM1B1Y1_LIMPO|nr:cardioactive peptide-like [Limulus polyphemus]